MSEPPEFPITVTFHDDREAWTFGTLAELSAGFDWFDSDDPDERATVTDALGRLVRLKVQQSTVTLLELGQPWGLG